MTYVQLQVWKAALLYTGGHISHSSLCLTSFEIHVLHFSGRHDTRKRLTSPCCLKWSIFNVWAAPVKVPWLLCLSGLSRFLRSSCVRQINLEDQPTSGLEIEMRKFHSLKKFLYGWDSCYGTRNMYLTALLLCWQRYRRGLSKAVHVFGRTDCNLIASWAKYYIT